VDESTVPRETLTHFWLAEQKRAIDIIKNDGVEKPFKTCHIDTQKVEDHFTQRCQRVELPTLQPQPWEVQAGPFQPFSQPSTDPFSEKEVKDALRKLPTNRSPGRDGVTYETLKINLNKLAPTLTAVFNVCIAHRRVPDEWKQGIITLVPKTSENSNNLDDWRPISLLSSVYKLFMSLIQRRLMPWIVQTGRLSPRQKGSLPRNGLQEHVYCLKTAVSDFLHQSSKLFIAFIDIKDAFGSLDHDIMIESLTTAGYPDLYIDITKDIYSNSPFQVKTSSGLTKPIKRQRGIIQGCPWSVIAFEQGVDKWLRCIDNCYERNHYPTPVQGYVDDVSLTAKSDSEIKKMALITDHFMNESGMEVKHRKCAVLHGQRTGNNWTKNSKTGQTRVIVQNEAFPMYTRDQTYKYLGYNISIDNNNAQSSDLVKDFLNTLKQIDKSLLPTSAKIEAINIMCTSKLNFYFPNLTFLEKDLNELEDNIVNYIRQWLCLNSSSTRSFFFTPKSNGGLGVISPRVAYYARHLAFILSVLNSDDLTVRKTARESLSLHITKRKAVPVEHGEEESFAGYAIENGKIVKRSKVYWSKSIWYHVFDMCQRESISLLKHHDKYVFVISVEDSVSFTIDCPKVFYNTYKREKLKQIEHEFITKHNQGRIVREAGPHADCRASSVCISNHKLSDSLRSFVSRGRLQLLQCDSLLSLYYPGSYTKSCKLCNHPFDTVSHVLNGCTKFQPMYQKRHNRIVDLIFDKIRASNGEHEVLKDTVLTPQRFYSTQESFRHSNIRPDITVIDRENQKVRITEIAVPFDAFLQVCFQNKFNKYFPLCLELNELGFQTEIVVLIIGSLGFVHRKFVSGLKKNNVCTTEAKFLSKYCSISAVIGSQKVWKQRCRSKHNMH